MYELDLGSKKIKVEKLSEVTIRIGAGIKQDGVLYRDEKGEVTVRAKGDFEKIFKPRPRA